VVKEGEEEVSQQYRVSASRGKKARCAGFLQDGFGQRRPFATRKESKGEGKWKMLPIFFGNHGGRKKGET